MSLTLNMVGGGGGGGLNLNNALIHVNAPLGSTVEFAKGGVTVETILPAKAFPNVDGETADYYYSVSPSNYGIWTVAASLSGDSASETITVDSNKQYTVTLEYNLTLFKDGVVASGYTITGGEYTPSYMRVTSSKNGLYFSPAIDLSMYARLEFDATTVSGNYPRVGFRESPIASHPQSGGGYTAYISPTANAHNQLDLTTLMSTLYFNMSVYNGTISVNNVILYRY